MGLVKGLSVDNKRVLQLQCILDDNVTETWEEFSQDGGEGMGTSGPFNKIGSGDSSA